MTAVDPGRDRSALKLRAHQRPAVADAVRTFTHYRRTQLIAACGCGKTVMGSAVARQIGESDPDRRQHRGPPIGSTPHRKTSRGPRMTVSVYPSSVTDLFARDVPGAPVAPPYSDSEVFEVTLPDGQERDDVEVRDHPEVPLTDDQRDVVLARLAVARVGPWCTSADRAHASADVEAL